MLTVPATPRDSTACCCHLLLRTRRHLGIGLYPARAVHPQPHIPQPTHPLRARCEAAGAAAAVACSGGCGGRSRARAELNGSGIEAAGRRRPARLDWAQYKGPLRALLCACFLQQDLLCCPYLTLQVLSGQYAAIPARYSADLTRLVGLMLRRDPSQARSCAALYCAGPCCTVLCHRQGFFAELLSRSRPKSAPSLAGVWRTPGSANLP
jgi:hypothetical protein